MGRVRLEIMPSLASISTLNAHGSDWLTLEREMAEGSTIGDLLAGLASGYTELHKVIFDAGTGKINEQLNVVLNNRLLPLTDMPKTKVNDGDKVILLPVYSGG